MNIASMCGMSCIKHVVLSSPKTDAVSLRIKSVVVLSLGGYCSTQDGLTEITLTGTGLVSSIFTHDCICARESYAQQLLCTNLSTSLVISVVL